MPARYDEDYGGGVGGIDIEHDGNTIVVVMASAMAMAIML